MLHALFVVATWPISCIPKFDPADAQAREDFEVVMVPLEEAPLEVNPDSVLPTSYTAIPERLATDEPPEEADFLALHHSLAADNKEGGDGRMPSADEEFVVPKVAISEESETGSTGAQYATRPLPDPRSGQSAPEASDNIETEKEAVEGENTTEAGQWALPVPEEKELPPETANDSPGGDAPEIEDWWGGQSPSILKEGENENSGDRGFDFNQAARGKVGSGVAIDGDFSLNTYEWDYAPWMNRFENELHRHWIAPYAYRIGIITGVTVIKLVVEKDGTVAVMEVIESDGHESLHDASVAALQAFAPYHALPASFPEENLVITLGLHYPAWRR
jgi:hypothetical protein